jgi:hypothetical protein
MSRKWIAALAALAAAGAMTFAASSVLGTGAGARPAYATVSVDLSSDRSAAARPKAPVGGSSTKKPKLTYLQSTAPAPINPADPGGGGVGPYIDVKLTGCSKVIDGGVVPSRLDVYVQGTYVKSPSEYHVLIGLDEDNLADRTPFTITSNLTCLKGVK